MSAATQNEMERLRSERDSAIEQVDYWRERALDAEGREQALAAHVGRVKDWWGDERKTRLDLQEIEAIVASSPEASLARLKAQWQAEALDMAEARLVLAHDRADPWSQLKRMANELRRQAEERR